jgi:hypothetical protein
VELPLRSMPRAEQLLHQQMQHFLLRGDAEKVFFHALAWADLHHLIARDQFIVYPLGRRENAHTCSAEGLEQGAVFEFAHQVRLDAQALEPLILEKAVEMTNAR